MTPHRISLPDNNKNSISCEYQLLKKNPNKTSPFFAPYLLVDFFFPVGFCHNLKERKNPREALRGWGYLCKNCRWRQVYERRVLHPEFYMCNVMRAFSSIKNSSLLLNAVLLPGNVGISICSTCKGIPIKRFERIHSHSACVTANVGKSTTLTLPKSMANFTWYFKVAKIFIFLYIYLGNLNIGIVNEVAFRNYECLCFFQSLATFSDYLTLTVKHMLSIYYS